MITTTDQFADLQQNLADNLNSSAQITAYCSAITNTTVAASPGAWYQPFMTDLATAQTHAALYLNDIGPDAWSTIPNAIVTYGQTIQVSMNYVQQILTAAGPNDLSAAQITSIQEIFENLDTTLTALLGTSTDTNLSVNGNPPPSQPTIYGCLNDLNDFDTNITADNKNLTTGQTGAAKEVTLLETDETKMNTDIATLNSEIAVWNQDILDSEIGLGISIFVAVVGIALAVPTGGASLVATGVGVAGIGGSIAGTVVYSDKVKAAQNTIAADQVELTTDQQQVGQLQAIIQTMSGLGTKNTAAQTAIVNAVNTYTSLKSDSAKTLTDIQAADSNKLKGIMENIGIQDTVDAWTNLVTLAQGVLNSSLNPQVLTPPAPTLS